MEKVFCNELQPGRRITTTDRQGVRKIWKIKKMIPMQRGEEGVISDVEILLKRKKNIYFSYGMYQKGESWVKKIDLMEET